MFLQTQRAPLSVYEKVYLVCIIAREMAPTLMKGTTGTMLSRVASPGIKGHGGTPFEEVTVQSCTDPTRAVIHLVPTYSDLTFIP